MSSPRHKTPQLQSGKGAREEIEQFSPLQKRVQERSGNFMGQEIEVAIRFTKQKK